MYDDSLSFSSDSSDQPMPDTEQTDMASPKDASQPSLEDIEPPEQPDQVEPEQGQLICDLFFFMMAICILLCILWNCTC